MLCSVRALPPHWSPPSAASLGSSTAQHIPQWLLFLPGCLRGHPPGHAPGHHHRQRVRHPPPCPQLPLGPCRIGRSNHGIQLRYTYIGVEPNGYKFVPFSVESYGLIGQPAMKLLHQLGDEAAGPGSVTRASLVASTLRELSVVLCRGNFLMYCASGGMLARVSGRGF
jgi:hypothetical protein